MNRWHATNTPQQNMLPAVAAYAFDGATRRVSEEQPSKTATGRRT